MKNQMQMSLNTNEMKTTDINYNFKYFTLHTSHFKLYFKF